MDKLKLDKGGTFVSLRNGKEEGVRIYSRPMNNSGENRWMKLRGMEGKSGEGKSERRDFSEPTFGEL